MGKSKLTNRQKNEILKIRKSGLSYDKIAKIFDVNVRSVYEIVKRRENKNGDK